MTMNKTVRNMNLLLQRILLCIAALCVFCVLSSPKASAEEPDVAGSGSPFPIELHKKDFPETWEWRIVNFDVSEDGTILLLLENQHILVLDSFFEPKAYFSFYDKNGVNCVQWKDHHIVLYSAARSLRLTYSEDGTPLKKEKFDEKDYKFYATFDAVRNKTSAQVNQQSFQLIRDVGFYRFILLEGRYSYQSLAAITEDGTERIVYQGRSVARQFWLFVLLVHIIGGLSGWRIWACFRSKKTTRGNTGPLPEPCKWLLNSYRKKRKSEVVE